MHLAQEILVTWILLDFVPIFGICPLDVFHAQEASVVLTIGAIKPQKSLVEIVTHGVSVRYLIGRTRGVSLFEFSERPVCLTSVLICINDQRNPEITKVGVWLVLNCGKSFCRLPWGKQCTRNPVMNYRTARIEFN